MKKRDFVIELAALIMIAVTGCGIDGKPPDLEENDYYVAGIDDVMGSVNIESFVDMMEANYGDYTYCVAVLQHRLIQLGYLHPDGADGSYGSGTRAAVTAFQKANGITVTGDIEEDSYRVLCSVNAVTAWDNSVAEAIVGELYEVETQAGHIHTSSDLSSNNGIIQYYASKTVPSTCTASGYTLHTCSVCGASYKDGMTPPKGHDFEEELDGNHIKSTCRVCGYTYTKEVQ